MILGLLSTGVPYPASAQAPEKFGYSTRTESLGCAKVGEARLLKSPDGLSEIRITCPERTGDVEAIGKSGAKLDLTNYTSGEIAWAPDSAGFFLTYTDGGVVRTYRTLLYLDEGARFQKYDLLLAAQVPPHSSCDSMGDFSLFVVSVPAGRVLEHFGQIESKRTFAADLGPGAAPCRR